MDFLPPYRTHDSTHNPTVAQRGLIILIFGDQKLSKGWHT